MLSTEYSMWVMVMKWKQELEVGGNIPNKLVDALHSCREIQFPNLHARIKAFSFSGFKTKLTSDMCRYVGSLVGRDFKMVAQVAPFILAHYMDVKEKDVWLSLSKVRFNKHLELTSPCTFLHYTGV